MLIQTSFHSLSCTGTILCFGLRIYFSVHSLSKIRRMDASRRLCPSTVTSLPTSVALCPWPKLHGTSVARARLCRSARALSRMWRDESYPFAAFRIFACISENISFNWLYHHSIDQLLSKRSLILISEEDALQFWIHSLAPSIFTAYHSPASCVNLMRDCNWGTFCPLETLLATRDM